MLRRYSRPLLLGSLILTLLILSTIYRDAISVEWLEKTVNRLGIWAPLAYIAIYASATVLLLPGSLMTIAGGFIFGPVMGTVINLSGAMIGSTVAFLIARYLAGDWVSQESGPKLKKLQQGIVEEGWRFVAFVRLVPLFPFTLLNYALGLTQVSLLTYFVTSAVFMLPGAAAYTYVGSLGKTALAGEVEAFVRQALIAIGLLVIAFAIPWFVKKVRKT